MLQIPALAQALHYEEALGFQTIWIFSGILGR
jgi:hypothetical protein